jgi:hypothetical protein
MPIKIFSGKRVLISVLLLSILGLVIMLYVWKSSYILEIVSEKDRKTIKIKSEDIERVGIDSISHPIAVVISLAPKNHLMLEKFTKENVGKEIAFRIKHENLMKGVLLEQITGGTIAFRCDSENRALEIIRKLGRNRPDYYLKLTPEELEFARREKEISDNIWYKKSVEALMSNNYKEAEKYAMQAIESNPEEPSYYNQLGYIYNEQNKKNLALKQLLKAKELIKEDDLPPEN